MTPLLAFGQSLTVAPESPNGVVKSVDGAKPPDFVTIPGDPRPTEPPEDAATKAIDPKLRSRINGAHWAWVKAEGDEFHPSLAYIRGEPVIMLVNTKGESPTVQGRRLKAMLSACEFLLDDTAFDKAVLCIATYDPKNPATMATRNVEVVRAAFQAAAKDAGKSADVHAALAVAKANEAGIRKIGAALGLD